jgi:prepilin-type N-terminal cleavage/methylation domain-containing protein
MQKFNKKGFTLIEVLIAGIILFLFITMASQAFSNSAVASLKAERAAKVAALVPLVVENIHNQIDLVNKRSDASGTGAMLDMEYHWVAKLLQRKPPPYGFDPSTQEFKDYEDRFSLWSVSITVTVGAYQRSWHYEEVSWYK